MDFSVYLIKAKIKVGEKVVVFNTEIHETVIHFKHMYNRYELFQ